jgi:hypothetical protein
VNRTRPQTSVDSHLLLGSFLRPQQQSKELLTAKTIACD